MRKRIIALLAGAMLMMATSALALTINYNTVLSGEVPAGSPPWLVATFTNATQTVGSVSQSGVLLTVNATGLAGAEFTTEMDFNSMLLTIAGLQYVNNSSSVASIIGFHAGVDSIIGAAGGANNKYDFSLTFQTSGRSGGAGRLTDNEVANIFLYNVAGLTDATFNAVSNDAGHISQAHIQGIGGIDDGSSWVTEGVYVDPHNSVPEPGTLLLLGFGMFGLAVYGKRRMNKEA